MKRSLRLGPALTVAWLLITPPYGGPRSSAWQGVGCDDPGHMNPCAPFTWWKKLGSFPDAAACRAGRDAGIVAAAHDDETLASWQLSRCFSDERIRDDPLLLPGE